MVQNHIISVIIPAYNAEKYIISTLVRLLKQTYNYFEIIVINDGSTDRTLQVIEDFIRINQSKILITVINSKNVGAANARNKGVLQAKGKYIQFLDADDFMDNHKFENQIKLLKGKEDCIVFCQYKNYRNHKFYETQNSKLNHSYQKPYLLLLDFWTFKKINPLHSYLIPKKMIEVVNFWDSDVTSNDDGLFMAKIILASTEIIFDEISYVYYVFISNSMSKQKSDQDFISRFISYNRILKLFQSHQVDNKLIEEKFEKVYVNIISNLLVEAYYYNTSLFLEIRKKIMLNYLNPNLLIFNILKRIFKENFLLKNIYTKYLFRIDNKLNQSFNLS